MMHENQMHEWGAFITLTFNDEFLPADGSIQVRHWQLFAKRLRRRCGKFRFFACGEYGERSLRPHYHAVIFGLPFADRKLWRRTKSGSPIYRSSELESCWSDPDNGRSFGFSSLGSVTFESAAYVARYVTKKISGARAAEHYGGRVPEFCTMSRRPGLGAGWFDLYHRDVFPFDLVVIRGNKTARPPRFYDKLFAELDPEGFAAVRSARVRRAKARQVENTSERLVVRERLARARLERFERDFEVYGE